MNLSNFADCITFDVTQKASITTLLAIAAVIIGIPVLLSAKRLLTHKHKKSLVISISLYSVIFLGIVTLGLLAASVSNASDEIAGTGNCSRYPIENQQAEHFKNIAVITFKFWLILIFILILTSIWNKFIKDRPAARRASVRIRAMGRTGRLFTLLMILAIVFGLMLLIAQ